MSESNTVHLSVASYNQIKNDNFRYNLFLDNVLQSATLSDDHQQLVFDPDKIEGAVKFCYFERYKKKLATLKSQNARYGSKN